MKFVERSELLPLGEYEQIRPHFRGRMIELKVRRRITVGEHISLVFENHDTVLLQIQEMLRTERITDEQAIAHELATYNELVPKPGGLSATLFIEYDDKAERTRMLERFASLRTAVRLRVGERTFPARFATHFGEELERLPAVNYLSFELGGEQAAPLLDPSTTAALEITHPDYLVSEPLTPPLREQLAADLRG